MLKRFTRYSSPASGLCANRGAFTLAEVLITLGLIAVVAAATMRLVNNYQQQQYVVGLQKAYSEFNQMLVQLTNEFGTPGDLAGTGLFAVGSTNSTIGAAMSKYFKINKDCVVSTSQGCMPNNVKTKYDSTGTIINYDDSSNWFVSGGYRFITANGTSIAIKRDSNANCGLNKTNNNTGNLTQVCGYVTFDINGPIKGPNTLGRDVFEFWISNGKGSILYPVGGLDDGGSGYWKTTGCDLSTTGEFCAARIIEENWQMKY